MSQLDDDIEDYDLDSYVKSIVGSELFEDMTFDEEAEDEPTNTK